MRIQVTPERLREAVGLFQQAQAQWQEQGTRLQTQFSALDWEASQQVNMEEQVAQATRLANDLAQHAGELANSLESTATRFEQADSEGAAVLSASIGGATSSWLQGLSSLPPWLQLQGSGLSAWERLSNLLGAPIRNAVPIPASAGQTVVGLSFLASLPLLGISFRSLGEAVWNWLHGLGWHTNAELQPSSSAPSQATNKQEEKNVTREPTTPKDAAAPAETGTATSTPSMDLSKAREALDADPNMKSMWKQVDAPIKSPVNQRSIENYSATIDQFDVEHRYVARYRPDDTNPDTRCNIFTGDVMRAMDAPLPTKGEIYHITDPMTANAKDVHTALENGWGGWRRIDTNNPTDLQILLEHLKSGKPAVASDPGHIAVIRSDGLPGSLDAGNLSDLHIAQAGGDNKNDILLGKAGYGTLFNPNIYIHE